MALGISKSHAGKIAVRGIGITSGQLERAQAGCGQEGCSICDPNKGLIACHYWKAGSMPSAHDPFGSATIAAGNFLTDVFRMVATANEVECLHMGCHINNVLMYILGQG